MERVEGKAPERIRKPAVAGLFYPETRDELVRQLDLLLARAGTAEMPGEIIAIIAPHAGYVYSGGVAARAYTALAGRRYKRVVVISPSHVEAFRGASAYSGDAYLTPLGVVPVDVEFCKALGNEGRLISTSEQGHRPGLGGRGEHALEVQLPFLQKVLGEFQLVPIVMGDQQISTCTALADSLAKLVRGSDTLIVASSDLSHFHKYDEARQLDAEVIAAIGRFDYFSLAQKAKRDQLEACGGGPIIATMMAAEALGADSVQIMKSANSGDIPGSDRGRVVGYVSAILSKTGRSGSTGVQIELSPSERVQLLKLGRRAVEAAVRQQRLEISPPHEEALKREAAVFVTLTLQGQLRGCIGGIIPGEPLFEAVREAAVNAALQDPRFEPVTSPELSQLHFEISVLSPFRRLRNIDALEIGKHGLLVERGRNTGLLLPQVAGERNWNRETFLEQTCLKAGLPLQAWRDSEATVYYFSALVFSDEN